MSDVPIWGHGKNWILYLPEEEGDGGSKIHCTAKRLQNGISRCLTKLGRAEPAPNYRSPFKPSVAATSRSRPSTCGCRELTQAAGPCTPPLAAARGGITPFLVAVSLGTASFLAPHLPGCFPSTQSSVEEHRISNSQALHTGSDAGRQHLSRISACDEPGSSIAGSSVLLRKGLAA